MMNIPEEFKKPSLTLGDWIISVLITKIPLIGFIILIVWAVDKNIDPDKANWAKAELIVRLIMIAIAIVIITIIGIGFFSNFSEGFDPSRID
jgi:heme/copper-type cytochrome/quinol oxidase subunit 2